MSVAIPDPKATAQAEAARITANPAFCLEWGIDRVLTDAPFIERESLLAGLEAFHVERMQKIPSVTTYPEAQPWVDYVLAVDKELQALAGLTTRQMAIYRSLTHYLTFRGYGSAKPVMVEKCRCIYLPETDQGAFHIKNVDDPINFWKPRVGQTKYKAQMHDLMWDGVGSGLHINDEPAEIFPLPIVTMCHADCHDVPGAVQFLTRYSPFWGGMNIVLFDRQGRNVAIEKCSHNFIEVFQPGANGGSHCSGMACRDPQSPQGQYQMIKRQEYLQRFNQPQDGVDMVFWNACDRAERMLGDFMQKLKITVAEILELFTTPWPKGLNKPGIKLHPAGVREYTLVTHAEFYDQRRVYVWQRDTFGNYPCVPDVFYD